MFRAYFQRKTLKPNMKIEKRYGIILGIYEGKTSTEQFEGNRSRFLDPSCIKGHAILSSLAFSLSTTNL